MFLCHVLDDFVLQPACLGKLKQRATWMDDPVGKDERYKNDYKCALLIHSVSWSSWILVPGIFMLSIPGWILGGTILINSFIHYKVDDLKANRRRINLWADQLIHIIQVIVTFLILITW